MARKPFTLKAEPNDPLVELADVIRRLPDAVVAGRSAGWLHGLDLPPIDPVEVIVRGGHSSSRAGVRIQRATLMPGEVVRLRGLPVTSALRTAIDLGRRRPLIEAVIGVDMALNKRLVSLSDLDSFIEANQGVNGIAKVRQAVELSEPGAQSPMETRLRMLLILAGLPRPVAQVPLYDRSGRLLGRPDIYYAAHRLGLEYDGGTHRASLVEDNRRQNRLQNAGYRLLRFTAVDIYQTPDLVVAQVRSALSQ